MKLICPVCQKTSPDGNLWCDRPNCPAGNMPALMDYGDHFGNKQIVRVRRVMDHATLYDAVCEGEPVLLKVAQRGNEAYLQKEVSILQELTGDPPDNKATFPATALPYLLESGHCVFNQQILFYIMYKAITGDFLCDRLLHHPEPWYKHVGWFMEQLSATIRLYHYTGHSHYALTPETIIVHQDKLGTWLPVLIDLGVGHSDEIQSHQITNHKTAEVVMDPLATKAVPIKSAADRPNQRDRDKTGAHLQQRDDFYQLGALMYEMLEGKPSAASQMKRTQLQVSRMDIPRELRELVAEWTSNPNQHDQYGIESRLPNAVGPRPVFIPKWQFWRQNNFKQRFPQIVIAAILILAIVILIMIFFFG